MGYGNVNLERRVGMTGLWLVSYLVLWVLVVVLCFFLVGILRQLGLLHRQLEYRPLQSEGEDSIPLLEQDGPTIGSPLTNLEVDTINGYGRLTTAMLRDRGLMLLVFMSPMCETCQHIVEPLNTLAADAARTIPMAVIMRADEHGCRAFLSVFPLHMPVVCDRESAITMGFDIHRTPFGLLYDEQGILIRKGVLEGHEDVLALLGDRSVSLTAQAHVFPRLVSNV
jgi:methylamine dehydrogenase accessory protein MauD